MYVFYDQLKVNNPPKITKKQGLFFNFLGGSVESLFRRSQEGREERKREVERQREIGERREKRERRNVREKERKQTEVNLPKRAEWVWVCLLKGQGTDREGQYNHNIHIFLYNKKGRSQAWQVKGITALRS